MTRKSEEYPASSSSSMESAAGSDAPHAPATPATDAPAADAAAPPTTAERDFDITLKNNDHPEQTEVVVARGIDGGLAAQAAMRTRPGWTADHAQTQEHAAVPGSTL